MSKSVKTQRHTLKGLLTFWLGLLLVAIALMVLVFICVANREVFAADMKAPLVSRVEQNAKRLTTDNGELTVGSGFIDYRNGIYCAVYDEDGDLLYGENRAGVEDYPLEDGVSRKEKINGIAYYLYDQYVYIDDAGYWLRGMCYVTGTVSTLTLMARLALFLLPVLTILTIAIGYAIIGQMLMPVNDITKAANSIAAEDDLSKRIKYNGSAREIAELTTAFNNMIGRLEKSFKRERQFTSDVSHELRTPLAVVLAECEYSLSNELSAEEYRQSLETVERQTKRMSGLITQLLGISRLEQGTQKLSFEDTDMAELVMAVVEEQQQITDVKLIPLIENDVTASVDIMLITRLLVNLIDNACKFGSTHVKVRLTDAGSSARISVEDDGIGIPRAEQQKIWERFYQVDRSRSENSGMSCGLGLAMVRRIAQIHAGTVTLESAPGEGSTFTLTVPKKHGA